MPELVIEENGSEPRVFELRRGPNLLGRAPDNAVVVIHESLSRRHACVFLERGVARLTDLDSKNGTFVDGVRVHETTLADGSRFACGSINFSYREHPSASAEPMIEIDLDQRRPDIEDFLPRRPSTSPSGAPGRSERPPASDFPSSRADRGRSLIRVIEILAALGPEDVYERILSLLFDLLPIDYAALLLGDPASGQLAVRSARWRHEPEVCAHSQHVVDYVRQHSTAVLFASAALDPRLLGASSIAEQNIRASMCVPLTLRDRRTALLYLDTRRSATSLEPDDLEYLCVFAGYAAVTIDNVLLVRRLEEEAVMRSHLLRFFPTSTALEILASGRGCIAPLKLPVTALFCDLSGFTTLSSTLDPVCVIQLLNEYFQCLSEIVFRHGGTLEKYIGDALLAVWGAPFSSPEDALKAVRAAIDMQRSFVDLERSWRQSGMPPLLGIHIGLDSGVVAAGNIGSDRYLQYATIGEATTLASRICSAARSGEILISSSTRTALGEVDVHLESLSPIHVKGRAQPLDVYRVVRNDASNML